MREPTSIYAMRRRAVRLWLLAVAALIFAMVLVGGATRLTESGLSITEWQPVTGVLPPLSDAAWNAEFDKYKAIPQYQQVNRGMTLAEFKAIFWWEWAHRVLGRVIGAAFLLPFLWFLWRGYVEPGLRWRLWTIFGLGAFQGAVGWWMVASGLAGRTEVSQYRLAFHLTLACVIYVATLWTADRLVERRAPAVAPRVRFGALALLVLVLVQIYLGALTAGLRAGLIYNTWPQIDGAFIPAAARLFLDQPLWRNFFENTLMVQFDHRMMAYTMLIVALLHAVDALLIRHGIRAPSPRVRGEGRGEGASPRAVALEVISGDSAPLTPNLSPQVRGEGARPPYSGSDERAPKALATGAVVLALAVTLQATLGILTLLYAAPLPLALAHQGMALVVLTLASLHAARCAAATRPPVPAPDRR